MPTVVPFSPLPISQRDIIYEYGPDSALRPGVRPGTLEEITIDDSEVYPGTHRRVWIHRPHGHDPSIDSAAMIFNDGWWYLDPQAAVRAETVLDNLAADGSVPQMVGVFVDPGVIQTAAGPERNRNAEYDAFDDRYATFLVDEVLPLVSARVAVSPDPMNRGICGGSSGGDAAFTAAWMRPDALGRVITFNASFAQMPGGNPYPRLLGESSPRPMRAFLHAAHRDLGWNAMRDNWFAENLETAAALARAGYDFRLVVGDSGHDPNHGGVLLPDALRWLWS